MLTEAEILKFINNDRQSKKKELARKGQAYYEAEHDIKKYKVYYVDGDGKLQEDKLRSNIKISHPFSQSWLISRFSTCFRAKAILSDRTTKNSRNS